MNKLENNKQINSGLFYKLLIFISIITTASSLVVITRMSSEKYFAVSFIVFGGFFLFYIVTRRYHKMNLEVLIYTIFAALLVIMSMLVNQDYNLLNFTIISLLFTSALFFTIINPTDFINVYIKSMVFLSIYSLIMTYLVPMIAPSIISFFPVRYNSGGFPVIDYFFSFQYVGFVTRNTGLFREMGVYSIYLNFALFLLLFTKNNFKHKTTGFIFLIGTILSTLSTPGIICMFLLIIAKFINSKKFEMKNLKIIFSFVTLILIINFLFPMSLNYINDSLNKITQGSSSYIGRIDVIFTNIKVWIENPIFGASYTESIKRAEYLSEAFESFHNTSTTTSFLAMYGLLFTIALSLPMLLFILALRIKNISKALIIIGLFLIINSQRLFLDSLFYFLTFCFLLILLERKRNGGVFF